jgi:hypothetical protein
MKLHNAFATILCIGIFFQGALSVFDIDDQNFDIDDEFQKFLNEGKRASSLKDPEEREKVNDYVEKLKHFRLKDDKGKLEYILSLDKYNYPISPVSSGELKFYDNGENPKLSKTISFSELNDNQERLVVYALLDLLMYHKGKKKGREACC